MPARRLLVRKIREVKWLGRSLEPVSSDREDVVELEFESGKFRDRSVSPRPKVSVGVRAPARWRWIWMVSATGSTSQYSATPCLA